MILLLIRHGHASKPGGESHLRLTARGQKEAAQAAQALKDKGVHLKSLWHSPKPRAVETARILLEKAGDAKTQIEEKKNLAPEGDTHGIYEELMALKPDCLALVSHLPFLEKLAYMIQEQMDHPPLLEFPTAGIQAFQWDGQWEHAWSASPAADLH